MRIALGLVPSLLVSACLPRLATPAGCAKDVDCKGARVCVRGECVEPHQLAGAGEGPLGSQQADTASPPAPALPAIVLPGVSPLFHVDWSHHGRSRYTVKTSAPRTHLRFETGGMVVTSPVITGDSVAIFGSHDRVVRGVGVEGKASAPALALRFARPTGDMVWCSPALGPAPGARPSGAAAPAAGNGAPASSAVVAYVGSDDDHLYALEAATGEVRWTFLAGPCKRAIGFGPEAARCDVDGVTIGPDGTIFIVADGAYALRPDGTLKWRFPLRTHCASAPAIAPDGTAYFGCQDGRLYAVGPDGTKRWDFRTGDDIDSSPAIAPDGTIYVGSDDHKLYAIAPAGVLKWALKTGGDVRSSPAIAADGTVYVGSFDGRLYAVRPDGMVAWTFSTADRVLSSPAIDAAGTVIFGSQDDRLYAVAPDGRLLWSALFDGDVDGTPAIGQDGSIWVGSDDKALHLLR